MNIVDRLGSLCGLASVPLLMAAVVLVDPASDLEASPSGSAELVARALNDNADSALAGAWCGLAGVFLAAVFFARLQGVLRAAAGPESWLPQLSLMGGSGLLATQLVAVGFAFAASDTDSYADNPSVAMVIMVFGWYYPAVYAPCIAAVMASVALVAFSSSAFPAWFAWASAAFFTLVVLVSATGAAGMAAAAGFFGLLFVAAVITFRREAPVVPLAAPAPA